jgi:glycosyltransferase involved in cell wall biosynthesis
MRIALVGPFSGGSLAAGFPALADGDRLPPGYPGAPLMTTLARALVDRGHEVAAISTCYTSPVADLEPFRHWKRQPGREIDIYFCPQRPHSFRSSGGRCGRAVDGFRFEREGLQAAIAHFQPELIHAHWTYEFVWAALASGVPTLATAHDSPAKVLRYMPNLYRLVRYAMASHVIARCMHLTAVSPDLERDIRRWAPQPITVVPNPIAEAMFDSTACAPQAFESRRLVMALNGWVQLKNGAKALRAFQLARRTDERLRLVCFGADYEPGGAAQRWATANGCADAVEFRGPTPHAAMMEEFRRSMALLHPSRLEACSMSIGEAMSLGLPVIAGETTGGVAWQLDSGRAGMLVDVNDPTSMARAIGTLAADRTAWTRISAAGRTRARELFRLEPIVDAYLGLYDTVCRESRRGWLAAASTP